MISSAVATVEEYADKQRAFFDNVRREGVAVEVTGCQRARKRVRYGRGILSYLRSARSTD
jgi:hypothetical protein